MEKRDVIPGEVLIDWSYFEGEFDNEIKLISRRGSELTIEELDEFNVAESLLFITLEGLRHLLPWLIEAIERCVSTDKTMRIAEISICLLCVWKMEDSVVANAEANRSTDWLVKASNFLSQEDCFVVYKTLVRFFEHINNDDNDFEFMYTYIVYEIDEAHTLEIWRSASL